VMGYAVRALVCWSAGVPRRAQEPCPLQTLSGRYVFTHRGSSLSFELAPERRQSRTMKTTGEWKARDRRTWRFRGPDPHDLDRSHAGIGAVISSLHRAAPRGA
jgi:hypothetical protein